MTCRTYSGIALAAAAAICIGCSPLQSLPTSPLQPVRMTQGSCVLDIFFVRFPLETVGPGEELWQQVDETALPADLRRRLLEDGFRVGVVGQQMPLALSQLLELAEKPADSAAAESDREVTLQADQLVETPQVVRRHLQIPPGRRREICASAVEKEMYVLSADRGGVCGRTYSSAQAMFGLQAFPQDDGRVRIELVPEIHHGQPKPRYVGSQGALRVEVAREREVYDQLAISAVLAPGEMLLVSAVPQRPGSLGYQFFTHRFEGRREQKLLVIRLSQTQHSGAFDPVRYLTAGDSTAEIVPEVPASGR